MADTLYKPQSIDTSIRADRFVFKLLKQKSVSDRAAMSAALSKGARKISLIGLKRTFSELSPDEFAKKVAFIWLGHQWPQGFDPKGNPMSWIQDSLQLAKQLHPVFEQAGIPYYITGGIAATAYGDPRTTRDLDVVLNIDRSNITALVKELETIGFYVPGVEDAISGRLNILQMIHQETILQADLIISGTTTWDKTKFERRRLESGLYFISPEDIILSKLLRRVRSRSDKQWQDILGVLKVQAERLDFEYLRDWASQLKLSDDFEQAYQEAGL